MVDHLAPYNETNMEFVYNFTWSCLRCNGDSQFIMSAVEISDCSAPLVFAKSEEYGTCVTTDQRMTLIVYLRYDGRYNVKLKSCKSDNDREILNTTVVSTSPGSE